MVTQQNLQNMHYQQDRAPAHFSLPVRSYLGQEFPGRWIGRSGPVEWGPRSPDLTRLDYFLWGELKRLLYKREFNTVPELSQKIM